MSDPDLVSCSSVDPEVQNDTIQSESFVSDLLSNYFDFSLQSTRTSQSMWAEQSSFMYLYANVSSQIFNLKQFQKS